MANTVNDVMNVIASPDYGIKNIAGTNQEILAILKGTHNSENNIYNIVDDVKNLLQKLVDANPKKKSIEVGGNNQTKINHKHIKDILDETKGIRKAIDNLSKSLLKQKNNAMPAVAKLSDKASEMVAEAMAKSINKNKNGGLSSLISAFGNLKNISLKDILVGKTKLKLVSKIIEDLQGKLNIDKDELSNVIKIINSAPELVKSLNKIGWGVNRIIRKNIIDKLSDILIGKNNSILSLSILLNKNKKEFDNAAKNAKNISKLASNLFATTLFLTTSAITGGPALLGITLLEKIVNKLIPTTKTIYENKKFIKNARESAATITVVVGLMAMSSAFLATIAVTGAPALLGAKLLEKTIDKLIPTVKKLNKNNKYIGEAEKSVLSLTAITGLMAVSSAFLATIAVTGVPALLGTKLLEKTIDKLIPITKKLNKNNKYIGEAAKTALILTAVTGLMAVSATFLATIAVTGAPALLGAKLLEKTIDKLIPTVKKLSTNNKHIVKAAKTALILTAVTGLMAVSATFLATIAVTGVPALLGSVLLFGIVKITTSIFKMLNKSKKNILIGSIAMVIMSTSLLLFGVALNKIVEATKSVSFKQVGIIAAMTTLLGGSVALLGIPAVFPFIALGSISMAIMGFALRPFAKTLSIISKATEKLKIKQVTLLSGAMSILALGVAKMALLAVPVLVGSITLGKLSESLLSFTKTLKKIASIGTIPNKQVYQVLNAMKSIGDFFKENKLKKKVIKSAKMYKKMLKPFSIASQHLSKLKELGVIPMKLVYQTLNAMREISNFYIENSIKKKAIRQAKKYRDMLRPFSSTIKHLSKLKELGVIPMKLVYQTLNAMREISNFYIENPIRKKAIRQAKKYRDLLRPFSSTIKHLSKLKELGVSPMKLVHQALNAISAIADYYIENPIRKKAIRQAKKYQKMLKPFGNTIKYLSKLKELGVLPTKLIYQTLNTMSSIANYYIENPIKKKAIKQAKRYKKMLKPFGNTIKYLSKLKELGILPTKLVYQTLNTMSAIAKYYMENPIEKKAIKQAKLYKKMLSPFGNTIEHLSKLKELGSIPLKVVQQSLDAISAIAEFYMEQDLSGLDSIDTQNISTAISEITSSFAQSVDSLKPLHDLKTTIPLDIITNNIDAINGITKFYRETLLSDDIQPKSDISEYIINKFSTISLNTYNKFIDIDEKKSFDIRGAILNFKNAFTQIIDYYVYNEFSVKMSKVKNMNKTVVLFIDTANYIKNNLKHFTDDDYNSVNTSIRAIDNILDLFKNKTETYTRGRRRKKYTYTKTSKFISVEDMQKRVKSFVEMANAAIELSKANPSNLESIGNTLSNTFNDIDKINMKNVYAVTDMFNAFNGINKSENIINKFTKVINEFTTACNNLMVAMGNNTDAINNMDYTGNQTTINEIQENNIIERGYADNTNSTNSIRISNVDEIARTIAEKINGSLSVDVADAQVQLFINGMGGNEWTISRY